MFGFNEVGFKHSLFLLKSGPFCGGTEKCFIFGGYLKVIHFVEKLKNDPFCGGTEKWSIFGGT
jgi:hypothetical protein